MPAFVALTNTIKPINLINSFNRTKCFNAGFAAPVILLTLVLFQGCMPPGPRAVFEGKRLIEQGKYSKALEKLKRATSLMATNGQAWNYLGLACHYSGQADQAERCYQPALALDHDLSQAHYHPPSPCVGRNPADRTDPCAAD